MSLLPVNSYGRWGVGVSMGAGANMGESHESLIPASRPGLKSRATHGSPYGTQEGETAVPEGTTIGSPGFQSRA